MRDWRFGESRTGYHEMADILRERRENIVQEIANWSFVERVGQNLIRDWRFEERWSGMS
jgi:hypothetical protein